MQHTVRTGNATITYSTKDAVFQLGGADITMEFHHYYGPSFWLGYGTEDEREMENWWECPELVKRFETWLHNRGERVCGG